MKKMKNFKKFLAISLAVMLVATALPFSALMASAEVPAALSLDTVETYLAALGEEETADSSVATWLKEYFVNIDSANNIGTLSYDAAALADYPNVKAYFANSVLTPVEAGTLMGEGQVKVSQDLLQTGNAQNVTVVIDNVNPPETAGFSILPALKDFTFESVSKGTTVTTSTDGSTTYYNGIKTGNVYRPLFFVTKNSKTAYEGADTTTTSLGKSSSYFLGDHNFYKTNQDGYKTGNALVWANAGNGTTFQKNYSGANIINFADYYEVFDGGFKYKNDYLAVNVDYTFEDYSANDAYMATDSNGAVKATLITAAVTVWTENDADGVFEDGELKIGTQNYTFGYRQLATEDSTPYFSTPLTSLTNKSIVSISIESELPAAPAEDQFRAFYAENKDKFTAATLAEAAELYNACSDAAKAEADIVAAYADIKAQIKALYVKDGKLEYKGDNADLLALALNNENDRLSVTESDVATSIGQKVKIAFDYSIANNGKAISFDVLPTLTAITDTENNLSISEKATGKFFELAAQSNKTFTVSGNSVSGQAVYYPMFSDPGNQAATSLRYKGGFAGNIAYSNATFNDTIYKESSTAGTWVYKTGNNIVFDFEYFVEDYTASDATLKNLDTTVKAKALRFSYLRIWTEDDGNNTFDEGDQMISDNNWQGLSVAYQLIYRYDSAVKELLPALSIPVAAKDYINYISVEETDEEAEFASFSASTLSDQTVFSSMLPILKEYAALDVNTVVSAETKDVVTKQAERLDMMPLNLGATVRTDADNQNIAFYGKAPLISGNDNKLATITKIGVIMKPYNAMLADGDKELTLDTQGAVSKEVTADEANINGQMFRFTLSGTDLKNSQRWGKWIVSRIYAEYTMADGSKFILYSLDTNDTNPVNDDFAYGTCVRSVNGVLKSIANGLYGKYTDNSEENAELKGKLEAVTGAAYKDVDNATQDKYVDLNLTDAYALANAENGKLPDAKEMLYFLIAFKDAVALIA